MMGPFIKTLFGDTRNVAVVAGIVALAFTDCHHVTLLGLLFRRIGDVETTLHGLAFFNPFNYDAVV